MSRHTTEYKIFIGFTEVAGFYKNLFEGLTHIGVKCGYLNKGINKFQYQPPKGNDGIFNLIMYYNHLFSNKTLRTITIPFLSILTVFAFIRIISFYNVIVLHNGSTLIKNWDTRLYKLLGLKVVVVSLGSDSRPPILNGALIDDLQSKNIGLEIIKNHTEIVRKRVKRYENLSDIFISSSSYCHFNTRRVVNLIPFGFPLTVDENKYKKDQSCGNKITILHAPTRLKSKGSDEIMTIINKISENYPINFEKLEGVSNQHVLNKMKEADLVIDQLYSDVPCPGLASEAIGIGVPAIVCGYYAEYISNDVPLNLMPETFYFSPDELYSKLDNIIRSLIKGSLKLPKTKKYNKVSVAQRFIQLLNDRLPKDYWFDPVNVKYTEGFGKNRSELYNLNHLNDEDYYFLTGIKRR